MSKAVMFTLKLTDEQIEIAVRHYVGRMFDSDFDVDVVASGTATVTATRKRVRKPAKPKVVAAKAA